MLQLVKAEDVHQIGINWQVSRISDHVANKIKFPTILLISSNQAVQETLIIHFLTAFTEGFEQWADNRTLSTVLSL